MQVVLTTEDLRQLSSAARSEVLGLLGPPGKSSVANDSISDEWFPVPVAIIKKFMSGIAEQSKKLLRLLAQNDGEMRWSEIRRQMGLNEWQDLKGFQAGMNRRLRGLLDDPGAIFVGWDESRVEYDKHDRVVDGFLKVHPETAKALRTYFGM